MAKLDKIGFAQVVAYLGRIGLNIGMDEIVDLDNLISIDIPVPVDGRANTADVDRLMELMAEGTRKIEAIKVYRNMTGQGLKEAKDAIERYWVNKPIKEEGAELSDILDLDNLIGNRD